MSDDEARAAARLAHDVGKHGARAARNLPAEGAVPPPLVSMLTRDLFATDGERPASAVFAERAAPLEGSPQAAPVLARCRAALAEVDALEARIRDGDGSAVRRAARLACDVEAELRELARALGERGHA